MVIIATKTVIVLLIAKCVIRLLKIDFLSEYSYLIGLL